PPATLTNDDLATFLDTNDEWIVSRTGMKERRISHVTVTELGHVAATRALAAAGVDAADLELIVFCSTTFDQMCPNAASGVQRLLGAHRAGCFDLNTACTGFMYGLSAATAMVRCGSVRSALIIGAETISTIMDWNNRDVAVLFGDGAAAAVIEASDREEGLLAESLGCYGEVREILTVHGWGTGYLNDGGVRGDTWWQFEGQDIFKRAVSGMGKAGKSVLEKTGLSMDDVDLVVPHQANLRIIDALGRRLDVEHEKIYVNVHRYGNMSAATAPVALVEALEEGRVAAGYNILMPAFGGGLTWSAHLIRWGERVTPLGESDVVLPPCDKTGLELVHRIMRGRGKWS
ncbi:MAG: beta-ketoacyl-ACP synthase 3, partial [Deltaproteobacteria bacterium]|nr:beta-ketoacyl-ACP synthase 3 [Deltaproteobacteria bacterium]